MAEQMTELVALARSGDAGAFATIYEQYAPAVCRFLRIRLSGSQETAEDVTSAVFLKVWQKLDLYVDSGVPFQSWLFRVARNCLIDHLRRLPRTMAESLDLAFHVPDAASRSEYGQVLDRQMLEDALTHLSAEQRRAVTLRFLEGRNLAETAIAMGRSTDAVKKLQARGLANLHRELSPTRGNAVGRRLSFTAA
jgi:RNA polymerase sigma-70 factor (ECF subfamily)